MKSLLLKTSLVTTLILGMFSFLGDECKAEEKINSTLRRTNYALYNPNTLRISKPTNTNDLWLQQLYFSNKIKKPEQKSPLKNLEKVFDLYNIGVNIGSSIISENILQKNENLLKKIPEFDANKIRLANYGNLASSILKYYNKTDNKYIGFYSDGKKIYFTIKFTTK